MDDILKELKKLGLLPVVEEDIGFLSSGLVLLDFLLGKGYPEGRIIELFGSEGSGKSYISLLALATAQRSGKRVALFDIENSYDPNWAAQTGVSKDLLVLQADYGEQVFEGIKTLAENGFSLVVVDSTAALLPKSEFEGDVEDQTMGVQARMLSKALRMITPVLAKNKCTTIFINQLREKIERGPAMFFGDPTDSPGGRALKFYASVRVRIEKSTAIKDENKNRIGHQIVVKVVKNKVGIPYREARFNFYYGKGIDEKQSILDYLLEKGVITQSGRKYVLGNQSWSSYDEMYNSVQIEDLARFLKQEESLR
jgi:recombination protein RecA